MSTCVNGHEMTDENTYRRGAYTRCRACHSERARRTYKEKRMITLPDRIAVMQAELDRLRTEYEGRPRSNRLAKQVAEKSVQVFQLRQAARPKPVYVKPEPVVYLSNPEWGDRLPEHCKVCGGEGHGQYDPPLPTHGYVIRVGNLQAKCQICHGIYDVNGEEDA